MQTPHHCAWPCRTRCSQRWHWYDTAHQSTCACKQGPHTCATNHTDEWVERFAIDYSSDGKAWTRYGARKGHGIVFDGNEDATVAVQLRLPVPLEARYIRIAPQAWHDRPALRVELYTLGKVLTQREHIDNRTPLTTWRPHPQLPCHCVASASPSFASLCVPLARPTTLRHTVAPSQPHQQRLVAGGQSVARRRVASWRLTQRDHTSSPV